MAVAKLVLPHSYRIHPVFHVSLFKPFQRGLNFVPLPPDPEIVDGIPFYKMEQLLSYRDKKGNGNGKQIRGFLIKWEGFSEILNSWEPEKNLT